MGLKIRKLLKKAQGARQQRGYYGRNRSGRKKNVDFLTLEPHSMSQEFLAFLRERKIDYDINLQCTDVFCHPLKLDCIVYIFSVIP